MKIFNNFDTKIIKNGMEEAIKEYGEEKVFLSKRYVAFWIITGLIPLSIVIIINIALIYIIGLIELEGIATILYWIIALGDIVYLYNLFNTYLEYKFDHAIITPGAITTHKQRSLFDSKLKELPANQIRSTQSYRRGIIGNIFGYGIIEILTDGAMGNSDEEGNSQAGKTKLGYVKNPELIRKKIIQITNISGNNGNNGNNRKN